MEIISPAYSFIKFNSPEAENYCCIGDETFCIPVIYDTDLAFQFIISGANLTEGNTIYDTPLSQIRLLLLKGSGNEEADILGNTLRDWTTEDVLTFEKNRTARNAVTYLWRNILKDITDLVACNGCFQLAVKAQIGDNTIIGISNCLVLKCDDCFTSVLEYYNDEDYAGFDYCNVENGINRVRLPFYLLKPKYLEERSVYRKSAGAIKLQKSILTQEYEVETEFFPKHIHDKLTVALAHDNVHVDSGAYTGGISKNGDYTAEWTDNMCTAPAAFKATATPYAIRNNNCADCKDVDLSVCTPVSFSGDPLPDAVVGIPYNASIVLTGDEPFVITANTVPAWMNISISGNTITLTGTPTDPSSEVAIAITIQNCDNSNTYDFNDTIDITASCAPVAIDLTPLPRATLSTLYNHDIALTGDAPFILDVVSKPSWMTITLVGSNVNLNGTPDAAGIVDVIFNVKNCSDANTDSAALSLNVSSYYFEASTGVTGSDTFEEETINIIGEPGGTATIEITTYTVTNSSGQVKVNGTIAFLSNTNNVLLDGTGHGSFIARVQGDPLDTGTIVRAIFTITAVTSGVIGTPDTKQISKVF